MTALAPDWRVGPLGAEAAELLAALHDRCFAESWTPSTMAAFLSSPGAVALLASTESDVATPVGFILARVVAGEAEVVSLGVVAEHRRRGCGRALLADVARWAEARGATALYLEVGTENGAAQALYRDVGFAVVGRRPGYYQLARGRREDALIMRRPLGKIDAKI